MDDSKINKIFVTVTVLLFCLAFLQLAFTGFPFAAVTCLAGATLTLCAYVSEQRRK
jgi:hypothetical protein